MYTIKVTSEFTNGTITKKVNHGEFGQFNVPNDAKDEIFSRGWSWGEGMDMRRQYDFSEWKFDLLVGGVIHHATVIRLPEIKKINLLPYKSRTT
jgi:hypothetical protein